MGLLMNLFGQTGKIRFEGFTIDGAKFTGKTDIEVFNMDKKEVEQNLMQKLYVEQGIKCLSLKIIGFHQTN